MGLAAWLTVLVVLVIFVALLRNWAPPDVVFLSGTALLALLDVITPSQAFAGFSNEGMLTVAVLFVVAAGLKETGVLDFLGHHVLGKARTQRSALGRISVVLLPTSAFLNNTPIVAMFMPMVVDWCRRNEVSPSKLLIPLSYLAILGGTCTLIGTSTNLVIHGLLLQSGMEGMGLFEIGRVGLPYAMIGIAYLALFGNRLLPERKELLEQLGESRREYLVEMQVQPECRLAGKSVAAGGLRSLPGLFLIEIDRDGEIITPVAPNEIIRANDRLVFTGVVSSVVELQKITGLVPVADPSYESSPARQLSRRMCEAVISADSPLIGETIRDADFRAVYGAAVVAVHRGGERVKQKVGDIRLQPGDTLLLQTQPHFARAHYNDPAFYLVSDVSQWRPVRLHRAWIAIGLFLWLIVMMTTGKLLGFSLPGPLFEFANDVSKLVAGTLVAGAMIATGCLSPSEARQSVEWQVLVTIAAAFGIGTALDVSGAAAAMAGLVVDSTAALGSLAALAAIYLIAAVLTELITNNAVAVLLFPVCLRTAELSGANPRAFLFALALAASASFMTPIGYQTNLMVYGPGGYQFRDFFRAGAPLSLLLWGVAMLLIPFVWPL